MLICDGRLWCPAAAEALLTSSVWWRAGWVASVSYWGQRRAWFGRESWRPSCPTPSPTHRTSCLWLTATASAGRTFSDTHQHSVVLCVVLFLTRVCVCAAAAVFCVSVPWLWLYVSCSISRWGSGWTAGTSAGSRWKCGASSKNVANSKTLPQTPSNNTTLLHRHFTT